MEIYQPILPSTITSIRQYERINKKIYRQKMSIIFNEICINGEMLPIYIYIYIYIYMSIYIYIYIYIYNVYYIERNVVLMKICYIYIYILEAFLH